MTLSIEYALASNIGDEDFQQCTQWTRSICYIPKRMELDEIDTTGAAAPSGAVVLRVQMD